MKIKNPERFNRGGGNKKKRLFFDASQQKSNVKANDGKAQCIQKFKATKTNTKTHEAVQNVTPIKYHVLKTQ